MCRQWGFLWDGRKKNFGNRKWERGRDWEVSPSFYLLGFAEEGVDDLELFGGEEFALGGVGGFGEFGHQWLIGVDFTGEAFACGFLTFGDVA